MGMSLTSDSGSERYYNIATWTAVLQLALDYGWKPAGTEDPMLCPDADWDGSYTANEGQCVTAEDAASLADALALVLLDLELELDTGSRAATDDDGYLIGRVRFPGPADKAGLMSLLKFCREGPFTIA